MGCHLHHVHIFASDLEASIRFYEQAFDGQVVLDEDMAGARNVFMKIGGGRLHFYDQPPKHPVRGNIHHFGIRTENIQSTVDRLKTMGVLFRKGITDLSFWKYIMVPAPDDILIELFEVDPDRIPPEFGDYFQVNE